MTKERGNCSTASLLGHSKRRWGFENYVLCQIISGTHMIANRGRRWHNCYKFLSALRWRGVEGFGLFSVCHLVVMLSVSALTFDSLGLPHVQHFFLFC